MAERTRAEADATVQSARATVELAEQGLLAYQPVLSVEVFKQTAGANGPESFDAQLKVVNVGMGPAVGCLVAICDRDRWCISPRLSISAAEERILGAARPSGVGVPHHWFSRGGTSFPTVIFCRDVTDRRYRFVIDGSGQTLAPEVRLPTAAPGGWWSDPRLWPPVEGEPADS